jgi:hypothetical protein
MLSNFIYAKQKSLFEEKLNAGEILDEAIVFIEDTKEIWNHGTYFAGSSLTGNVQAVDTGDVLDDVNVEYTTKAYVDGLVGDKQNTITDLETIRQGAAKGAIAIQAVDTGDVIDDVTVNYATKTYVDGLVGDINSTLGDINSVLESIINGGASPIIITFNVGGKEYQAEEGMTFYEWGMSKYYDSSINLRADLSDTSFNESCQNFGNTSTYCFNMAGMGYAPSIYLNSVIQPIMYTIAEPA